MLLRRATKTRTLMTVTAGNRTQLFQSCLSNWLCIITTMILQNNIARFSLCPIESFHSWVLYFGEPRRTKTLITVAAGNRTQLFHIIFRNGFDIITTLILQNNISRFSLCPIESFYSWVCYFGEPQKTKTLMNFASGNRK